MLWFLSNASTAFLRSASLRSAYMSSSRSLSEFMAGWLPDALGRDWERGEKEPCGIESERERMSKRERKREQESEWAGERERVSKRE